MADKLSGHVSDTGTSIAHPEDDGAIWDPLKLGPITMPGVWKVTGSAVKDLDVKKPKGSDGARFRDHGYKPAPLRIVGKMIGAKDWNEVVDALKIIRPRKQGKTNRPLACEHPAFTYLGITNILITSVAAPVVDSNGVIVVSYGVIEWLPKPTPKKRKIPGAGTQFSANLQESIDEDVPIGGLLRNLSDELGLSISPAQDLPGGFITG